MCDVYPFYGVSGFLAQEYFKNLIILQNFFSGAASEDSTRSSVDSLLSSNSSDTEMGEEFEFTWSQRGNSMTQSFQNFWEQKKYTDIKLIMDDEKLFELHKLVLMASSSYFERVLSLTKDTPPVVILRTMPSNIFELLVEFMYKGTVRVKASLKSEFLKQARSIELKGMESLYEKRTETPESQSRNGYLPSGILAEAFDSYRQRQNPALNIQIPPNLNPSFLNAFTGATNPFNFVRGPSDFPTEPPQRKRPRLHESAVLSQLSRPLSNSNITNADAGCQNEPQDMSLSSRNIPKLSPISTEVSDSPPKTEDLGVTSTQGQPNLEDSKQFPILITPPSLIQQSPLQHDSRTSVSSRRKASPPIKLIRRESDGLSEENIATSSPDKSGPMGSEQNSESPAGGSNGETRYSDEERSTSDPNDHSGDTQPEYSAGPSSVLAPSTSTPSLLEWKRHLMSNPPPDENDPLSNGSAPYNIFARLQSNNGMGSLFGPTNPIAQDYLAMILHNSNAAAQVQPQPKPKPPKNEKNYVCDKCNRSYTSRGNLQRHLKYECGVPPKFRCPLCNDKHFCHGHSMKIHMCSVHTEEVRRLLLAKDKKIEKMIGFPEDSSGEPVAIEKYLNTTSASSKARSKRNRTVEREE